MKLDILAIGVHPDDVELSCAGTILKHIAAKKKVGILDLTRGELGTRGNAEIRTKEAKRSAKILGIAVREQMNFADGFFQNDEEHQRLLIEKIRLYQPEIVLCNALSDRHPDHGRSGKLEADACFYSGLVKIETSQGKKKQQAWRPKAVYHYIQDNYLHPDFVIDITKFMDKKMEAIMAFESQFYDPNSKEPMTAISGPDFFEQVKAKNSIYGRMIGVRYAEGFVADRTIGVKSLFDLK
jgi:bacillithiol biosynthesis deacetylase BshB1